MEEYYKILGDNKLTNVDHYREYSLTIESLLYRLEFEMKYTLNNEPKYDDRLKNCIESIKNKQRFERIKSVLNGRVL